VAVSEQIKNTLMLQGIPGAKIEVVRNGIDAPAPAPYKSRNAIFKELALVEKAVLIGCVGRLCKDKGQEELLRAAAHFMRRKNIFLIFVGEDSLENGRYERHLQELADSLEIASHVRFLGYQSDVNSLMHAFDCLVLPSWSEGFPLVVLEAMAAAKPVIATRVGGIPELVQHDKTGYLINPGDVSQLAQFLDHLLSNPELAANMGRQGLEHVKNNFSKRKMLERIMAIYDEITHEKSVLEKTGAAVGPDRH
jgi:glycosyltransferase involved in cell wall biosynthesis